MTGQITGNEAIKHSGLKWNTFYKFVSEEKIEDKAQTIN